MQKKSKKKEAALSENLRIVKHISLAVTYGILFLFLVANILFSQTFPDMYNNLFNNDEEVIIEFFKRGKSLPMFSGLFPEVKNTFSSYEQYIYHDERQRKDFITKLEILLTQNPQSRDILYSLYLLYDKEKDTAKANEYLQRAKDIDPMIGR